MAAAMDDRATSGAHEAPSQAEGAPSESSAAEDSHQVVAVRTTGVVPESVAEKIEHELRLKFSEGWQLERIVPVIYNSSTTGYFLLVFVRRDL